MLRSKLIVLLLMGLLVWPSAGAAAASPVGITISPFIQEINLQPGQGGQTFEVTLTNNTSSLQELDLSVHDFGSLNDTGGIILESNNTYTRTYGLTSWLTLDRDTVNLNPGQSATVNAAIDNRSSLRPGGHYGAIIASVNSFNQPSGNEIFVNQQLTALVLVDKMGGEHYDLKLDSVSHNGNWLNLPNTVRLTFQNPGNVHVIPRGLVKLKSPSGKVLSQGIINSGSAFILPESFRQIYVPLTPVSRQLPLPGLYSLEVDYRYDGINVYATKNYKLKFIDLKAYAAVIVGLLVVVWAILRYKRHTRRKKAAPTP